MKFPFHITLLTLLIGVLALTGSAIGFTYYLNTRRTVETLAQQVLGHAEKRIDEQVNHLLFTALEQCELNRDLLEARRPEPKEVPRFATFWVKVLRQHTRFAALGFSLEATGDAWYVKRQPNGDLVVVEAHWNDQARRSEMREYAAADYHDGKGTRFQRGDRVIDSRKTPWYVQAKRDGKQVWTETYMLPDHTGEPNRPGLSCSVPVHRDGVLHGVFSVTFELERLGEFLQELEVGEGGFPFLVEYKADNTHGVIAHPDPPVLLETVTDSSGKNHSRLVSADSVRDPRVRSFLREVRQRHVDLVPSHLKKMTEAQLQHLARIRFTHDGIAYRGTYRCLSSERTPDWLICIIVPESGILGQVEQSNRQTLLILLLIGLAAFLASLLVALQVARPLQRLARQTEAIGQFHLAAEPIPSSIIKEVDRLAVAMENMKLSLRSFAKYVPTDVVRALLAAGQDATLGGENRIMTIYFSDIADFTSISEDLTPELLVTQLGEYFSNQSRQILEAGGTVDKYIGDAIMAFWGAPAANPQHALGACKAALHNQQQLRGLRDKWKAENKPLFSCRIGVNTGEVVVGNIGSEARLNYTVIGDAVNLASRLEGLNKYYGTEILISESTYQEAKDGVVARPLDWVSVKGKTRGVLIYELLGLKGEVNSSCEESLALYALALTSYRHRDWTRAIEVFQQVLALQPDDRPTQYMIERCRAYQVTPPPGSWDGVYHMAGK